MRQFNLPWRPLFPVSCQFLLCQLVSYVSSQFYKLNWILLLNIDLTWVFWLSHHSSHFLELCWLECVGSLPTFFPTALIGGVPTCPGTGAFLMSPAPVSRVLQIVHDIINSRVNLSSITLIYIYSNFAIGFWRNCQIWTAICDLFTISLTSQGPTLFNSEPSALFNWRSAF